VTDVAEASPNRDNEARLSGTERRRFARTPSLTWLNFAKYHSPSLPSETETPLPLWLFHLPGTENLNVSVDVGGSGAVVGWVVGWKSRNSGPSSWQGKPRKGSLDVGVRDGRGARK
jgi:hypothetical protein